MSQVFDEKGMVVPVTLIEAGPCAILQVKTEKTDGYESVQMGFEKKTKNVKKTDKGKEYKHLREFRVEAKDYKVGDKIDVSTFKEGDIVKIAGVSKGKGFQGAVKRWGFHGKNASHGTKHEERTLGSVGSAYPQRVLKGKKMPGRMGAERVTVKNLKIVKVDPKKNLLFVKGAIPGRRGTLLEVRG